MAIRRLEILGCVKRVLARVTDRPTEITKWMQCIKYVKLPTDEDRNMLTSMTHDQEVHIRASKQQGGQDIMSLTHHVKCLPNGGNDEVDLQGQRMLKGDPLWTPHLSYLNLIYDCVEDSDVKGISSMVIYLISFSYFSLIPFRILEIKRSALSLRSHSTSSYLD